MTYPLF
jgi:hypothetical protein